MVSLTMMPHLEGAHTSMAEQPPGGGGVPWGTLNSPFHAVLEYLNFAKSAPPQSGKPHPSSDPPRISNVVNWAKLILWAICLRSVPPAAWFQGDSWWPMHKCVHTITAPPPITFCLHCREWERRALCVQPNNISPPYAKPFVSLCPSNPTE